MWETIYLFKKVKSVKIITYDIAPMEGKITNSRTDRGDVYFGIDHYGDLDNDGEENQKGGEAAVQEHPGDAV